MDLNRVELIGRLTGDPEKKSTPTGTVFTLFQVATNYQYGQGEEKKDLVEYHSCVAWGKNADNIDALCRKGSKIYVEGRNQTRSYETPNGEKKWKTEIIVSRFIALDTKAKQKEESVESIEDFPF